ncbi:hypothetical protein BDZ94DRAFT_1261234 [Collybia nuda]|uniref:Uncharacterized protein n=1 Tax=Collybia nuda TaxID=64659 RepID=A0A9P5Y660_9AGAR|nr:hypothetical protein BDZ94DRAFT_1261234 [Collybia nuda]
MTSRYGLSSITTTPLALHDIGTTIQPYEPNAEIHIDSSQVPPQRNQTTYIQYSRSNPLGLRNTGLSEAGASSGHWGSPYTRTSTPQPIRRALHGYTIEGGWQQDEFGGYRRVEGGKLEEINHDVYEATTPVPHGLHDQVLGYLGPMRMTEPLPSATTPPPRPMPRTVEMLRSTSTGGSVRGITGPTRALSSLSFTSPPISGPPEVDILTSNLRFVDIALTCVDNLSLVFTAANNLFDVHSNVDACDRIKTSLLHVKASLARRSRFSEDQWRTGSQSSHLKYNERLSSLERTIHKFCKFENYVRTHRTTSKLVKKSVDKLQEYESKFLNLNIKFNAHFDRIRIRCLHSKIIEAHAEAQRIRTAEHAKSESFKTRWAEGKALRSALRRDYHAYRNGRHSSQIS